MARALILVLLASQLSAQPEVIRYDVIDLGAVPGWRDYQAWGINNAGQIVGRVMYNENDPTIGTRAVIFDANGGGPCILFDKNSGAFAINESGIIVGQVIEGKLDPCDQIYYEGSYGFYSDQAGNYVSTNNMGWFACVNNSGIAAGAQDEVVASIFRYPGQAYASFLFPDCYSSDAYSINDYNTIAGVAYMGSHSWDTIYNNCRAMLGRENGEVVELGTLGGLYSLALAINNLDQVVGIADMADGNSFATLFSPQGTEFNRNLGTIEEYQSSCAMAINEKSEIVGFASFSVPFQTESVAVKFDSTGFKKNIDLNTRIDPLLGWQLWRATGINDKGWIIGDGSHNGLMRAFLLKPAVICTEPLVGDTNNDCQVNFEDLGNIVENWLTCTKSPQSECF